jgi:phage repressor protein C with HTH and peptisase S24 domain
MTQSDEQALDHMMRMVGRELERRDDELRWQDEPLLRWLADDLQAGLSRAERERDEGAATAFAHALLERRAVDRARERFPARELRYREAATVSSIAEAVPMAGAARCAAVLDLAAAAGAGRELWDDPCDTWLELPPDVPNGKHVSIRVEGDSMEPVLKSGDLILVKLDVVPVVDDLVLARRPNAGFVVKRVSAITPREVELSSFNADYPPFTMRRGSTSILGTVIARFSTK